MVCFRLGAQPETAVVANYTNVRIEWSGVTWFYSSKYTSSRLCQPEMTSSLEPRPLRLRLILSHTMVLALALNNRSAFQACVNPRWTEFFCTTFHKINGAENVRGYRRCLLLKTIEMVPNFRLAFSLALLTWIMN